LSNKLDSLKGGRIVEYRVKEIRENAGITQEDLAIKAGVSRTIISGLESGAVKETSTRTLRRIADALGKSVSELFF
jgi:transcriptional regulator with XRE-family HTH domain